MPKTLSQVDEINFQNKALQPSKRLALPLTIKVFMFLFPVIYSLPTCTTTLFPKIIGGTAGHTHLHQIDIFNDDLAFAGNCFDNTLTTYTSYQYAPLVGVIDMSLPGTQFKWVKANDRFDSFECVQFSQDGKLLAAIKGSQFNNIVIFNSSDGTVKTYREYNGNFYAFDRFKKSIIISSGSTPIAYVTSNYYAAGCQGNLVFSFDPLTLQPARWAKRTNTNDCENLGITFGNSENIIYAFSQDSGSLKVSRINDFSSPPTIEWTYGFTGNPLYTLITHKNIDQKISVMVITGRQSTHTYFGVLIIPLVFPYTPKSRNLYQNTELDQYSLKGIYIQNQTFVKVLFYNSANFFSYLTSLNLKDGKFTSKKTFPYMLAQNVLTLGVFSHDGSKFYASSYNGYDATNNFPFFTNLPPPSNQQTLGTLFAQAFIYSSDQIYSSYVLFPDLPELGILSVIQNGVTAYSDPYFDLSGFGFTPDPLNQMNDLIKQNLNTPNWVIQQSYTINEVSQPSPILTFEPGIAKTFSINPFTATYNCGSVPPPPFIYTGFKTDTSSPLVTADHISVSSSNGSISVTSLLQSGTYTVIVKGGLTVDGVPNWVYALYRFTLIGNYPPVFSPPLEDKEMYLLQTLKYKLPTLIDVDIGQTLSILSISMSCDPSFYTYNYGNKEIIFSPTKSEQQKIHLVTIQVTDGLDNPEYTFLLTVFPPLIRNLWAPTFKPSLEKIIIIPINTKREYTLPIYRKTSDLQVLNQKIPAYASFKFPTYTFSPKESKDIGVSVIEGIMKNSYGYLDFEFVVFVENVPPSFKEEIDDQIVSVGEKQSFLLPEIITIKDDVTIQLYEQNKKRFPSFMRYDVNTKVIYIEPNKNEQIGVYKLIVKLRNSLGAEHIYAFNVEIAISGEGGGKESLKQQALVFINKINRDGSIKLKLETQRNSGNIVELIKNETIQFTWISLKRNEIVKHTIIQKDSQNNEISVQLKFDDPNVVSNSSTRDILELIILEQITFKTQSRTILLIKNQIDRRSIPPQLNGMQLMVAQNLKDGRITITSNEWYDFLISFVIQMIWMNFEDFSFLMIITMISISVPGIAQIIQQVLVNFIYLDLLVMEKWMPQVLDWINGDRSQINDEPLNDFFDENGFGSKLFMNNIGSTIIYFLIFILMWVILALLNLIAKLSIKLSMLSERLKNKLMWSWTFSFLLSQFVPFLMSSLINFGQLQFSNPVEGISVISSFYSIAMLVVFLIFTMRILQKAILQPKMLESEEFQNQYGSLVEDLNLTPKGKINIFGIMWNWVSIFRWALTVCILIYVRDYNSLQILLLIILSILSQSLLLLSQPYSDFYQNLFAFFYEFLNSAYLTLLLSIAYLDDENIPLRNNLGLGLVTVVTLAVLVNLVRTVLIPLKKWLSAKLFRPRVHKAEIIQAQQSDLLIHDPLPVVIDDSLIQHEHLFGIIPQSRISPFEEYISQQRRAIREESKEIEMSEIVSSLYKGLRSDYKFVGEYRHPRIISEALQKEAAHQLVVPQTAIAMQNKREFLRRLRGQQQTEISVEEYDDRYAHHINN